MAKYIIKDNVTEIVDGVTKKRVRYYGGNSQLGYFDIQRWDVPEEKAKVFPNKAEATRVFKALGCHRYNGEWAKIQWNWEQKNEYEIVRKEKI